jgi:hypothetical protein
MEFLSDYRQFRWFLIWNGQPLAFNNSAYPGYTKFAALTPGANLCLFAQVTKTVSNGASSGLYMDDLNFTLRNRLP